MNSFKNPLGVSLGLLLVAVVAYFYTVEAPKLTTVTTKKEVAVRATAINYEGAMVVSEVDDINDILAELEANPPAGGATFDMATMARSITAEALKAFSDSKERALPLTAHWNVGESEGMDPMYMLSRIELGEHILVSWKLDPYYADNIGSSYYEESVKKAAELNLPLVFVLPAPESALTKENYYRSLEAPENPNVVDTNGDIVEKLSPFGPDELWSEMGEQWASTALMAQLQEWYPNPPLVVFVSKDEADKLLWSELETSSRYQENYPAGKDDSFKRTLVGAKWIEKYRQMHDGFKKGFSQTAWKENVKFVSYNKLSDNLGISNEWINNATLTNQYMNVWPLTADGVTIDFNLLGDKSDTGVNAPHILANNLPFMLSEAKLQNPSFSYQLSIDDSEKLTDVARYRGLTQFALWFLRPSTIRQASTATTTEELEPMYQELSDSVELIHYNEQLASFWRDAELVSTGGSELNKNIPSQYQNDPRAFLLETDVNPAKPWDENTNVKVWAFALVKGESPNREWLVYAQSPEGNRTDVTVTVPEYQDIKVDSSVNGSFYSLSEKTENSKIIISSNRKKISITTIEFSTDGAVNIEDFGAVGDGVTDNTKAIINAFKSSSTIYIPSGTYLTTDRISIPKTVHIIYGEGTLVGTSKYGIFNSAGSEDLIIDGITFTLLPDSDTIFGSIYFDGALCKNITIQNCKFVGSNISTNAILLVGYDEAKIDNFVFNKNEFINIKRAAIEILHRTKDINDITTVINVKIINNMFRFDSGITKNIEFNPAISLSDRVNGTLIENNIIDGYTWGIETAQSINTKIISNTIINVKDPINSSSGTINNFISDNNFEFTGRLQLYTESNSTVINNTIKGTLYLLQADNILIENNRIISNGKTNIWIDNAKNNTIENNYIENNNEDAWDTIRGYGVKSDKSNLVSNNRIFRISGNSLTQNIDSSDVIFQDNLQVTIKE